MTAPLQRYASSPATRLEAVFRDIERTRMAGLPILNPALAVEAVDFSIWQGHWLGVLITPWFMNGMLLPGVQADWQSVADGKWVVWQLPAGERRFYSIVEPDLGEIHAHSLYSPVSRFSDQVAARAEAQRCLSQLLEAPPDESADECADTGRRAFLSSVSGRTRGSL
jgi:[NiFe] hydrogenase assembly HybE family chaperone